MFWQGFEYNLHLRMKQVSYLSIYRNIYLVNNLISQLEYQEK